MSEGGYSWQLTERERRRALTATLAAAATFVGPLGPLMVWAFEYVYDRRNLIFNQVGTPVQAYGADRSAVGLDTLAAYGTGRSATLSVDTSATGSNLRLGDPVSVVLSEHSGGRLRNGLVVPTRVGERVSLSLPRGSYSLTAFGGRRETLFTTRDPYSALGGNNLVLDGQRQLYLPLSARSPAPSVTPPLLAYRPNPLAPLPRRTCPSCGSTLSATGVCPKMLQQPTFRCRSCTQHFRSSQARSDHERNMHWTAWDFIQDFFGNR